MIKNINIKKIVIIVLVIIALLVAIFFIGLQTILNKFSKEVSKIDINDVNIQQINDGKYIGEFFVNESVGAVVEVKVENNEIRSIKLIDHKSGRGQKAEAVVDKVINNQSLNVDTISGATGSSKVILKAIENALTQSK